MFRSESKKRVAVDKPTYVFLFSVLVAVNCLWVLSLPLFPSQDGPVHLYYSSVIQQLLSGSQLFGEFFSIRHPLPPYSFQYLLLYELQKVVDPLWADKLIICFFILVFCFGFRYLVRAINRRCPSISFLGIPLSLNWMLGMGFMNYSLSLAFSLVAIAIWLRASQANATVRYVLFFLTLVLILFTHPVPLFIVIAFIGSHTALGLWRRHIAKRSGLELSSLHGSSKQVITALLSCGLLIYVFAFVSGKKTAENLHHQLIQRGMLRDFFHLRPLMMIWGSWGALMYRTMLFVLLAGALYIGLRGLLFRLKRWEIDAPDLMVVGAACLLALFPFIPRSINGSDFFADRLVIYIWLFAIAGASAYITPGLRSEKSLIVVVVCTVLLTVWSDDRQVRSAAQKLMQMERVDQPTAGSRGIFIYAPIEPGSERLTFGAYQWAAARYFRRTETVLLNAPWLDLPILPLAPTNKLFTNLFAASLINRPDFFSGELLRSQKARDLVGGASDFILFVGYSDRDPKVVDNLLKQRWQSSWNCIRTGWYSVCTH